MIKALSIGLVAAASIMLGGCASQSERVSNEADLLAAAGFTVSPANAPERQASMAQLPPNSFVRQAKRDQVTYLYADPLVCNCTHVGDQQAYARYQQEVLQRKIARQQELTAEMNAQAQDSSAPRVVATRWHTLEDRAREVSAETVDDCHVVKIVLRTMNCRFSVSGRTVKDGVAAAGMLHVTEPNRSAPTERSWRNEETSLAQRCEMVLSGPLPRAEQAGREQPERA